MNASYVVCLRNCVFVTWHIEDTYNPEAYIKLSILFPKLSSHAYVLNAYSVSGTAQMT